MPKHTYTAIATILILALTLAATCTANPLRGTAGGQKQERIHEYAPLNSMLRQIATAQKDIRSSMAALAADMNANPFGISFWMFMGLAFLYGTVHGLGPGHGKFVIFSYLTGRSGDLLFALATGSALAIVHVLSAVAVILALLALHGTASHTGFEEVMAWTELASYALLAAIGATLAVSSAKRIINRKPDTKATTKPKGLAVALAAGLIPCPGAAIILLFSLSMGIFLQGLMAMSALATGMALSISCAAILAVAGNRSIASLAAKKFRALETAYAVLTLAGSTAMAAFGVTMLMDRL